MKTVNSTVVLFAGKACDFLCDLGRKARNLLPLLAVVASLVLSGVAFAEDEGGGGGALQVNEIVSGTDISGLVNNMSTSISGPVKTALGVSAGFVILAIIWRVVTKYMRRGA